MKKWIIKIIETLFPNYCQECNKRLLNTDFHCFCKLCWDKIEIIKNTHCRKCGKPVITSKGICHNCLNKRYYYKEIRVSGLYDYTLKKAIHLYKYTHRWKIVHDFIYLIKKTIESEYIDKHDYIVPVPITKKAYKERGFHHTFLLSKKISKRYDVEYIKDLIIKHKETSPQSQLKREARLINLMDSFKVNNKYINLIKDKSILICDDVYTTGSTVQEIAKTLHPFVKEVNILTIARGR